VVSGDLTVTPGQTLYVNVGGAPTGGGNCERNVACIGGINGGGSAYVWGGGGGGASDVRTVSRSGDPFESLQSRLIVAAGGGGGGGDGGGKGGDAGSDGDGSGGTGGKAGTQSSGGLGGRPDGFHGVLGRGGNAGFESEGGGGGGGLYGGGSGDSDCDDCSPGGGGGGSNLVPQGGSATLTQDTSVAPSVTISYRTGGVGEPPPTEQPQSKEECKKGGYEEFGYKNQGQCIKAVNHPS
jgi:hypothetical protein